MDTQITTLRETNPALKSSVKLLSTKLGTLKSAPITSELSSLVSQLQTSIKEKREKLEGFKSGNVKMVTKEELERIEKEYRYWSTKRKARKIAFENLEAELLVGFTKEEIWERAGLEEDVM